MYKFERYRQLGLITVPAYFNDAQRKTTEDAAKIADDIHDVSGHW